VTDDIAGTESAIGADLLVVAGVAVDELGALGEVAGGAARYATESALAAGLRVALHTVAGDEPVVRDLIARLAAQADLRWHRTHESIRFTHDGVDEARRLRLKTAVEPIRVPDPALLRNARSVLFAPVAGEVAPEAMRAVTASFRAAGIQGWLRATDADGWVTGLPPSELPTNLSDALRGLDLLIASRQDLAANDGPGALAGLRQWAGAGPELVVTAGHDGAWLDDGRSPVAHVPADVVEGRNTVGAGDAFAAVLVARRGADLDLRTAARDAAAATARYLASRAGP
jgi:sugar/nucleoside kinase (ribokinase family)